MFRVFNQEQFADAKTEELITQIFSRRVNSAKANEYFREALQKILDREWMHERDLLRQKIQSGSLSDDEAIALVKEFDHLRKNPPKIV